MGHMLIKLGLMSILTLSGDTAGLERYKAITSCYYKGAHGIIFVYDITDEKSFINISTWMTEVKKNLSYIPNMLLIGNKTDLILNRVINYSEGKEFAELNQIMFLEVNAIENKNINTGFKMLLNSIYLNINQNINTKKTFSLSLANKKKECC